VPGNIQSIERAAAILRLLSGRTRRLGVVDLAGELGLSKGTVHGLLRTLQHVGFVEQDPETGKYKLGAALLHMGSSYLDGNELRTRALNWSDSLASRTQEAVRIGTLHEGQVLIVHHVFRPDDSLQTLDVGTLLPAHATALGKVLLAHHPYVAAEVTGNGLASFTDATICDQERLEREPRPHARARLGCRDRRAEPAVRVAGGADHGPQRPHGGRDGYLRSTGAAPGGSAAARRAVGLRARGGSGPCRVSSARSRGEREAAVRERYVAAIDQCTASSRCLVFDRSGRIVSVAQKEHHHIYPKPGWVEHDPEEIWRNVESVVGRALGEAQLDATDLVALGIANQRETTLVWDRVTGQAVHHAINWQDTRTDHIVRALSAQHGGAWFRERSGLPPATYFSGPKLRWLLDTVPGLQQRAEAGEVLFGTMDSWLIWKLTGRHLTDLTTPAAR